MIDPNLEMDLEAMIDRHGLTHVVNTLAVICSEKADHIRSSYGAKDLTAKAWRADSNTLDRAARRICSDAF